MLFKNTLSIIYPKILNSILDFLIMRSEIKCHSYKKRFLILRLDLTFIWTFIIENWRKYFFYRTTSATTTATATGTEAAINTKNSSKNTINNKNKSDNNIGISNSKMKNSNGTNNNNNNSHKDDSINNSYRKSDVKNYYASGRNVEYIDNDPSDRSCQESDFDSSGCVNNLPPKQGKYTRLLLANILVQYVPWIPANINETVIFNVKSTSWISLLASFTDWFEYRSMRYRDCAGSKMRNEDNCIFYLNFGKWNEKYCDKNGNCAHCAVSAQHIDWRAWKPTWLI